MTRATALRRAPLLLTAVLAALLTVLPAPPARAHHTLAVPSNLVATAGDGEVHLSWDAVDSATTYWVQTKTQFNALASSTVSSTATSITISNLTNGEFYLFRVQASDSGNNHTSSGYGDWVTVMPEAMNAAGSLDASFGTGGRVVTAVGSGNLADEANSVAVQDDGKIVVVGYTVTAASEEDFAVVRYNPDGSLDTTFGTGGKVITAMSTGLGIDKATAVAIQDDGKIVVVGVAGGGDFGVARYTDAGALDTTFGTGGKVTTSVVTGGQFGDAAYAVAIQDDDKIVVAGVADDDFGVVRYTTTGALDSTFGAVVMGSTRSGKVVTDIVSASEYDEAKAVAIQSDGKIVAAGDSGDDVAVVRYEADGDLDATFDTDGKVTTDISPGYNRTNGMAIDADGKIVVVGNGSNAAETDEHWAMARYTTAGALDTTFGTGGKVTVDFNSAADDEAEAVAIQSDGKIVVAGYADTTTTGADFALARFGADGSLDAGFGGDGTVTTAFQNRMVTDIAKAVAIQSDGKIVATGRGYGTGEVNRDIMLARYSARAEVPTLVGNLVQIDSISKSVGIDTESNSQGFTTGANSAGYVLSSVELDVHVSQDAAEAAKVRAELWSSNANGRPNARLEALDVPDTLPKGVNSLGVPPGTALAPETTYHVVIYTTAGLQFDFSVIDNDDEDSGKAAGFSIADGRNVLLAADPNDPGQVTWSGTGGRSSIKVAVKGAARPEGSGRPIWSATLNAASVGSDFGCLGASGTDAGSCGNAQVLSNTGLFFEGSSRWVTQVEHTNHATDSSRSLSLRILTALGDGVLGDAAFKELTLHVGNNAFAVGDTTGVTVTSERVSSPNGNRSQAVWTGTGMTWAASDRIRVTLTVPEESSNNDLSMLSVSTHTQSTGSFSDQTLSPAFVAGTKSYDATVGNDVTHAKLTATVADTGKASLQVAKQGADWATVAAVASGTASDAFVLAVGDNALVARVTAENGDTQDYTVTVRRQSNNADLSGLSASKATGVSATFTTVALVQADDPDGGFDKGVLSYSAVVGSSVTHAKLRPSVDDASASVKVAKQGADWATVATVASGAESGAIGLDVGVNALVARVTAENGVTKEYVASIERQPPSADLSALSVAAATSETGTYYPQPLSPLFSAQRRSLWVTVGNDVTHGKVTATAADADATVKTGKSGSLATVNSGDPSGAIALDVGDNVVLVEVTAVGGTPTKTYRVTVERQPASGAAPAAGTVSGVSVLAHHEALVVSWTPPSEAVTGYDVEYKERGADDRAANPSDEPSTGWVALERRSSTRRVVDGLINGTVYDVRVRHVGASNWVSARGTPRGYRLTLSAKPRSVAEGASSELTASLDRPVAWGVVEVSFYEDASRNTLSVNEYDFVASDHTSTGSSRDVTIREGRRSATARLDIHADTEEEPTETLRITASVVPADAITTIIPLTVTVPGTRTAAPPPGGTGAPPPGGTGAPPGGADGSGGEPQEGSDDEVTDPAGVTRLAGSDRYATARAVAQQIAGDNDGTLDAVVIVGGHSTADAVIAASLAGALDAAVLLAGPDGLSDADIELLTRTKAGSVIAVGAAEQISDDALAALEGIDPDPERITGADPYETSAAVAQRVGGPARLGPTLGRTVVVARGETFADGLVAGPFAAAGPHPILLAGPDGLHPDALSYLAQHADTVVIIGGLQAVPQTVQDTITSLERRPAADTAIRIIRIGGDTRYDTARRFAQFVLGPQVAPHRCTRPERAGLAVGTTPADAAVAAPLLAKKCAPVLLTRSDRMPQTTREHLQGVTELWVIGGHTAIPPATLRAGYRP